MFKRLLESQSAVSLLLTQSGMDETVGHFGSEQWSAVEAAYDVLAPCFEATAELPREKMATASKVIPITNMPLSIYSDMAKESGLKGELASNLLHHLVKRITHVKGSKVLACATLLDPRLKNTCFRQLEKKTSAIMELKKELQQLENTSTPAYQETVDALPKKSESSLWDSFDKEVQNLVSHKKSPESAVQTLNSFFEIKLEDRKTDALQWWVQEGANKSLSLAQLATKYLSIPATSVPSERVFSAAGEIISGRRNRLGDTTANIMLTSMHSNLKRK